MTTLPTGSRGRGAQGARGGTAFLFGGLPAQEISSRLLPGALRDLSRRFDAFGTSLASRRNPAVSMYLRRYRALLAQWRAAYDPLRMLPHWIALPVLYAECTRCAYTYERRGRVLRGLLWGQFCMFLAVRLLDDLADGQAADAALAAAARDCMAEADRAFAASLGDDGRARARAALAGSLRAIPRTVALQTLARPPLGALLRTYRQVNALFKPVPHFLALRNGEPAHARALAPCYDELAIGLQLLDDLEDLRGDFRAGRRNAVIAAVNDDYPEFRIPETDPALPLLPHDTVSRIVARARACFDKAAAATRPLAIPAVTRFVRSYTASLEQAERNATRRVRSVRITAPLPPDAACFGSPVQSDRFRHRTPDCT
jgi:hypothetical protein